MISKELLEILACPVCKASLGQRSDGALQCAACRRVYPIRDGIPILLAEEGRVENG